MSEEPNSLSDIFDGEGNSLPADIPTDDADIREHIGEVLGFNPENPDGEFGTVELAEVYAALKDVGYER